ncbi:hypothetical protein CPB83DRAFT_831965 [Crepidotus variabilis]|uniref:Uncharacterized protein n=1 Tax=Crepidotus variabilis TaxID=179855 RepID=A0A9P6ERC8_9AGAR|nr:hypothetical protein CPB83DRAFT_831965 [Crepidotus variabilis]
MAITVEVSVAIYVLFYILRSRQKLISRDPHRLRSTTYSKRPTLMHYPSDSTLNPSTRSRSSSINNSRIPRGYVARMGHKIRPRSFSPIRVSPSRPVIFGERGEEEHSIKVTLMVTPPTPAKKLAKYLNDEDESELDSLGSVRQQASERASV